jgi:hypothetical protein
MKKSVRNEYFLKIFNILLQKYYKNSNHLNEEDLENLCSRTDEILDYITQWQGE